MPRLDNKTDRLTFIAPSGGVVAGSLHLVENTLVFATEDADETDPFVGVHKDHIVRAAVKATGAAWAVGDRLYLNSDELTTVASGGTAVNARAAAAAASGDTTGDIELTDGLP